jgi:hypothetical protein
VILYVDDIRNPPFPAVVARSYAEAISMLESTEFEIISLDHDLACFDGDRELTGYDVAIWLEERAHSGIAVPEIRIHSANPVGRARIQSVIDSIRRMR